MLSAAKLSATTPLSVCIANYGSTRGKVASLVDWWTSGTTSVPGVKATVVPLAAPSLMWMTLSAIWVTCCALVGVETVPVPPDAAWPWGKLRKLLPLHTSRHLSPKVLGKVYTACVRSAMLHGDETWGRNILDLKRLRCNDRAMICWIYDTKEFKKKSWNILSLTTPENWH